MSKIKLKNVRLSFASVFRKATFNGDETKYEGTFLIDKETQAIAIDREDELVKATLLTADGAVVHPSFSEQGES